MAWGSEESGQGTTHQSRASEEGSHPSRGCVLDSSKVRIYCMEPTRINAVPKWRTVQYSVLRKATSHGCTNNSNENCEYSSMCCETSSGTCTCPICWSALPIKGVCSRCFDHHGRRQSSPLPPVRQPLPSALITSHDGHRENLESPTVRRCEQLRRMTSRTQSTRRGCAVTAGSHLLCGQSRSELAEPASCLPVVSLIGWYLVLAPICPRRNSVRVRNIFSTANPALPKKVSQHLMIPKSESDKRKTIFRIAPKSAAERIHVANF
jgi:hypothetical protein